ncbi:MAG TPA: response regulator [Candidatus Acidoferrales bacterium]|nr:response regulator [Candidatus Acidoferrales bacterium]
MSSTYQENNVEALKASAPALPAERRRRKRVKVSAQVRVRSLGKGGFTEIAMTVDVSRDGILFSSTRSDFSKGMPLGVTFPFSNAPNALNAEQPAEVVRMLDLGDGQFGVAVQFTRANQRAAAAIAASGPGSKEKSNIHGASNSMKGEAITPGVHRPIVLAVEDDRRMQEQLRALLTPEGYDVFVVRTGTEALDILRTTVPSCFIADIEAEGTNGYDLCLIIKNSDRLARVPVVLVTRSAQPADYAASRDFGAVVCMAKPFQPERMLQVVRLVAPSPFAPAQKAPYGSRDNIIAERAL